MGKNAPQSDTHSGEENISTKEKGNKTLLEKVNEIIKSCVKLKDDKEVPEAKRKKVKKIIEKAQEKKIKLTKEAKEIESKETKEFKKDEVKDLIYDADGR